MNTYPKELESLLRKANLLGSGHVEIRGIHRIRTKRVSDDGEFFQEERRPDVEDILTGSTTPVKLRNGQIAGYWANGLTSDEKEKIHIEAGVPYYYLGEPINQMTKRPEYPDTHIAIKEGEILDMTVPAHVAKFNVLVEGVYVGHNKQDAEDNDALFYFYSRNEEQKRKRNDLKEKKKAFELIDELDTKEKRQVLRIMTYKGYIAVSHYIDSDDVPLVFDDLCFDMPLQVVKAHNQSNKNEFIICKALLEAGHLRESSEDGPYYKDEVIYGSQEQVAENFAELMKVINSHSDLKKAFYKMEEHIKNVELSDNESTVPNSALEIMRRHGLAKEEDKHDVFKAMIARATKSKILKLLSNNNIDHDFTGDSSLPDMRELCLEHIDKLA